MIFDEILVNAVDNKQRDQMMNAIRVCVDVEGNSVSLWNNGDGVPVEVHQEEKVMLHINFRSQLQGQEESTLRALREGTGLKELRVTFGPSNEFIKSINLIQEPKLSLDKEEFDSRLREAQFLASCTKWAEHKMGSIGKHSSWEAP
ncbi:hypothetical protein Droror1_Dr00022087 [Drosera rotundifolia]